MITMIDAATKIELVVPENLVERYQAAGYAFKNRADAPKVQPAHVAESEVETKDKELSDHTNKELVAYGEKLGLSLKANTPKKYLIAAIEEKLGRQEDADDEAEAKESDGISDIVTSRNWSEG